MDIGVHLPTTLAPTEPQFRRPELGRMLELLELVAGTLRPAVTAA